MGYFIRRGDKTTCGGVVLDGHPSFRMHGIPVAREGDPVTCGKDGKRYVIAGGIQNFMAKGRVAGTLDSFSTCPCQARLIHSLPSATYQSASNPAPSAAVSPSPAASTVSQVRPPEHLSAVSPTRSYLKGGPAFIGEPEQACVFAKTCTVPPASTEAGTQIEPVANFGQAVVMGSTAIISTEGGATLGRVAGQATLETLGTWSLRGTAAAAGTAASTLLLALWPTSMGTSTLTEEQLRGMMVAPTRVRFQFRRDAEGIMRVYGIHTSVTSGMDRVPVVSQWRQVGSAMEAQLGGVTIIWTPNNGPVVQAPTTYPGVTGALDNILVHPVAEGSDSQLEIYPASDDMTWQDCILVFPVESGVPPLYLVFAKPAVNPLEVDIYGAFSGRARNGLHVDHMPSQAAIRRYLEANLVGLTQKQVDEYLKKVASIVVPARVHQKFSETYGWRNSKVKQFLDAGDLRAAVDSNFDAISSYMLEEGFAEVDLKDARAKMHQINEEQGWY